MKKYKLLKNKKLEYRGRTLYRIQVLKNFGNVEKGDLGGWIEKEANLSQEGDCWVYDDAKVFENAEVYGDALVYGDAWVFGDAEVYGYAEVSGNAKVYGDALVFGYAEVYGDVKVFCNARVFDNALVFGYARVFGDARVFGYAEVSGNAWVYGYAEVFGEMKVSKTPINISGLQFGITTSDNLVRIGCEIKTLDEWLKVSKKEAIKMELNEENYSIFKDQIKLIKRMLK